MSQEFPPPTALELSTKGGIVRPKIHEVGHCTDGHNGSQAGTTTCDGYGRWVMHPWDGAFSGPKTNERSWMCPGMQLDAARSL